MPPNKKKQQSSNEITKQDLPNSVEDIDELDAFKKEVQHTYSVIRAIDTTGFEPASIFMPTVSLRESQ